jgi:signal transduction histidine kinase
VRGALNRLALAITSMVAIAFLLPLMFVTRQIAHDRALADAQHQASAMVAALAVGSDPIEVQRAVSATAAGSDRRMAVFLPGTGAVGVSHVTLGDIDAATRDRRSVNRQTPGGIAYLQPSALDGGRIAVIEVYVPEADLDRGVTTAWLALLGVALVLVTGSTLVADRLGARIVRAARDLAGGARRLGAGELGVRVAPTGPPELRDAADAFNSMAANMLRLMDAERELAADLSHRLRTPLTALRLDADAMPPGPLGDRMRTAFDVFDAEIEAIITGARRTVGDRAVETTDLVEVLAERLAFWSVLAEDHRRPWRVHGGQLPVFVPVPQGDLILAVDAMLGNVFAHTPEGTPFEVTVLPDGFAVDDAGPGIADPAQALTRGASGAGSTGLGLDIVNRLALSSGGRVELGRGPLGGARVRLVLGAPLVASADAGPTAAAKRRRVRR